MSLRRFSLFSSLRSISINKNAPTLLFIQTPVSRDCCRFLSTGFNRSKMSDLLNHSIQTIQPQSVLRDFRHEYQTFSKVTLSLLKLTSKEDKREFFGLLNSQLGPDMNSATSLLEEIAKQKVIVLLTHPRQQRNNPLN